MGTADIWLTCAGRGSEGLACTGHVLYCNGTWALPTAAQAEHVQFDAAKLPRWLWGKIGETRGI